MHADFLTICSLHALGTTLLRGRQLLRRTCPHKHSRPLGLVNGDDERDPGRVGTWILVLVLIALVALAVACLCRCLERMDLTEECILLAWLGKPVLKRFDANGNPSTSAMASLKKVLCLHFHTKSSQGIASWMHPSPDDLEPCRGFRSVYKIVWQYAGHHLPCCHIMKYGI